MSATTTDHPPPLPRVTIQFCTQCKWMFRAAYVRTVFPLTPRPAQYAQELLSTFSLALGEVALQPSTGGAFVVAVQRQPRSPAGAAAVPPDVLWDRRVDGGFPETRELERRLRDVIQPGRDLGHVDRHQRPGEPFRDGAATGGGEGSPGLTAVPGQAGGGDGCEDCAL